MQKAIALSAEIWFVGDVETYEDFESTAKELFREMVEAGSHAHLDDRIKVIVKEVTAIKSETVQSSS